MEKIKIQIRNGDDEQYSVHISSATKEKCKREIKNYNEKVIIDNEINIVFEYPLTGKFEFKFCSKNGFTLGKIIWNIISTYHKIYSEKNPEKYGIWGHAIGDLYIEGLAYQPDKKKVYLSMGS